MDIIFGCFLHSSLFLLLKLVLVFLSSWLLLMLSFACSLLALSPDDVLPAVYLCTNRIAADHENMVSQ